MSFSIIRWNIVAHSVHMPRKPRLSVDNDQVVMLILIICLTYPSRGLDHFSRFLDSLARR